LMKTSLSIGYVGAPSNPVQFGLRSADRSA
jgi:hypothetical protein